MLPKTTPQNPGENRHLLPCIRFFLNYALLALLVLIALIDIMDYIRRYAPAKRFSAEPIDVQLNVMDLISLIDL